MTLKSDEVRRLHGEEEKASLALLESNWQSQHTFDYKSKNGEQPSIVLCQYSFRAKVSPEAFTSALQKRGVNRLIVFQEWHPDGTAPVWEQAVTVFYPQYCGAECVAICPDADLLFYASHEGSLTASGNLAMDCLKEMWPEYEQYRYGAEQNSIYWNKLEAAREAGYAVKIWDAPTGALVSTVRAHSWVHSMGFSNDERFIVLGGMGRVSVASVASGADVFEANLGSKLIAAVALSGDGSIAAAAQDDVVYVWNTSNGELVASIRYTGGCAFFSQMAFSPDGKHLAIGDYDGAVRVFQVSPLKEKFCVTHTNGARTVCFSRDGRFLATGGNDNTAKVTDVAFGTPVSYVRHSSPVIGVSVSNDGKSVASVGHSSETCLWALQTGLVLDIVKHDGEFIQGANAAEGDLLVYGRRKKDAVEEYFVRRKRAKSAKAIFEQSLLHFCEPNAERIESSSFGYLIATAGFNV